MKFPQIMFSKSGVIPLPIILAIAIGALLLGGLGGFVVYFTSHAISGLLVGIACAVIFLVVILPNLELLTTWSKKVSKQVRQSIKIATQKDTEEQKDNTL
ncbi:MAG: hypothetical protein ACYS0I_10085 [Planctomycetota bacterium]|jgi:hypothetical protein